MFKSVFKIFFIYFSEIFDRKDNTEVVRSDSVEASLKEVHYPNKLRHFYVLSMSFSPVHKKSEKKLTSLYKLLEGYIKSSACYTFVMFR